MKRLIAFSFHPSLTVGCVCGRIAIHHILSHSFLYHSHRCRLLHGKKKTRQTEKKKKTTKQTNTNFPFSPTQGWMILYGRNLRAPVCAVLYLIAECITIPLGLIFYMNMWKPIKRTCMSLANSGCHQLPNVDVCITHCK
jgi:hypothetical protein